MSLESITWLSDLVVTNPASTDFLTEGDDHIKGIKVALKNSFTGITGAVTATHTELNKLAGFSGSVRSTTPIAGEWVLMNSTAVTAVAAIDFVNGTGGVTISSAYDAYIIEFAEVNAGSNTDLRLQLSTNAGSSFPSNATGSAAQSQAYDTGAETLTNHSGLGYFPVSGGQTNGNTTAANGWYGRVTLTRVPSGQLQAGIHSEWQVRSGLRSGTCRGISATTGSAFDAIRLLPGTGSFGASGTIKLFGRKV